MKVGTDGVILGAWSPFNNPKYLLDIGTGSGLLALMLQQRYPEAIIDAIDIDALAVEQAQDNFKKAQFQQKPSVSLSSFQDYAPSTPFNAIVCNPPYFKTSSQSNDSSRNTARQTLHFPFPIFFSWCVKHLTEKGQLAIVFPAETEFQIGKWAYEAGLFLEEKVNVYSVEGNANPNRTLYLWSKENCSNIFFTDVIIREKSGEYTQAFETLTKNFYL